MNLRFLEPLGLPGLLTGMVLGLLAAACTGTSSDDDASDTGIDGSGMDADINTDDVGDTEPEDTEPEDTEPEDTELGDTADADDATDDTVIDVQSTPYAYIQVIDRENEAGASATNGVDIVTVELVSGGTSYFADQVHHCEFGSFDNSSAADCNQALGAPAGGVGDCIGDPGPSEADYVSLGGEGGSLIVSVGDGTALQTGDEIRVYECGREQNPGATDELYDVLIGVSASPDDPNWLACIMNGTGISSCIVPTLPEF